jgi:hypothetical protein
MKTTRFLPMLMTCAALFALTPASAQIQVNNEASSGMATPPRLSVTEGNVQFWRPGASDWEPAQINTALAEGDAINTGGDATVELQIGQRDFVRLPANTLLSFEQNNANVIHFRLVAGTASVDLRGGNAGQLVRIDTEGVNIVVASPGYYRILVRPGEARITVRNNGLASMTFVGGRTRSMATGEEVVVLNGGASVDAHAAPAPDAWDQWNDARSDYYAASTSYRYVSPDVYGAPDLDNYGSWREDVTYGSIWLPTVAVGWSPYSMGRWHSHPYYGWTWVDTAPWGWTTSHYGRWISIGGRWAWAPGPRQSRVVYSPALVAFFQGGGGMSWVALGWGEPLLPWWGSPSFRGAVWWGGWYGPRVVYQQNNYIYRNTTITKAVIVVRESDFGHRPVRGSSFSTPSNVRMAPVRELPRYVAPQPVRRDAMPPPRPAPAITPRQETRPAPMTRPAQENRPAFTPAPATRPAPESRPAPVPTPATRPTPESRPAPMPTPATRPAPESRPAPMPTPATRPAPESRPAPMPTPATRPAPESRPAPTPTPATRPAPESRPAPAPAARPAPAPAAPRETPRAETSRPQAQSQGSRSGGGSSSNGRGGFGQRN